MHNLTEDLEESNLISGTRRLESPAKESPRASARYPSPYPLDHKSWSDPPVVLERMQALGDGEWVFRSRRGTPLDPKNTLNRYVRPVVESMGIEIGGFHDFRHTLTTNLRRGGIHPKVISGLLGHSKVDLAMNVYDHLEAEELRAPLAQIASQLNPIEPKLGETA